MHTHTLHMPRSIVEHNRIAGTVIPALTVVLFAYIVMVGTWGSPEQAQYLPQWVMVLLWNTPTILMFAGLGIVIYSAYLFRSYWAILAIPAAVTLAALVTIMLAEVLSGAFPMGLGIEWDIFIAMIVAPVVLGAAAGTAMVKGRQYLLARAQARRRAGGARPAAPGGHRRGRSSGR